MYTQIVATGCLGWSTLIALVTTLGTIQIYRHYSRPPSKPVSSYLESDHVPHVTIIRPCKGLEPFLYECLAATFHQDYPTTRVTIHFCVASNSDAAYPILQQLLEDYASYDARIYVEDEDPVVQGTQGGEFGPNPKIRNMSRAYREAKGDIIWILDCNIWMNYGSLGRMVDKLCGFGTHTRSGIEAQTRSPYKLVAHLPVCVDVDNIPQEASRPHSNSISASDDHFTVPFRSSSAYNESTRSGLTGSMLETSFLSTAHAKMYVAINTVSIAPCINGKSTMFRKSHLDHLTQDRGIDYFSHNICEDHLIGDLLWKSRVSPTLGFDSHSGTEVRRSNPRKSSYKNHGLAVGDLAIQPVAGMKVASYIARRVRWLRVRKFTVMLATLVEPGTESLVCCAMGAFALTSLDQLQQTFGSTWSATAALFATAVLNWCAIDWFVSGVIQGMGSIESKTPTSASNPMSNVSVPPLARPHPRKFSKWIRAWLAREALALPIWTWAIWGGTTVTWREKRFWVGMDMRVHKIPDAAETQNGYTKND